MGLYIATDYNPYDGFNHLVIRFDGFDDKENLSQKEFVDKLIKLIKKNWPLIDRYQKKGALKKRHNKPTRYEANCLKWKIFKRDSFTCQECGSQDTLELDHIIPISKGGSNKEDNLQTLCKKCNHKKGDKIE